jgi:hypothetical protein
VAEVRVVKLPLNVNPTQPLAGNTLDSPDQNATADFKLVLVLKPTHDAPISKPSATRSGARRHPAGRRQRSTTRTSSR